MNSGGRDKALAQMERWYRIRGFEDGLTGRKMASQNATYRSAWRRGALRRTAERRVVDDGR
jgi:hypothetical protein